MIKKSITFENYNGEEETEDFYFNLSKGELVLMELAAIDNRSQSFQDKIERISKDLQGRELADVFEDIVLSAYGEKSADGKRFIKTKELSNNFKSTGAYSELIVQLLSDAKFAADFMNGLVPEKLRGEVAKDVAATTSQSARERSESQLQGYQKKSVPDNRGKIDIQPELPTSNEVQVQVSPQPNFANLTDEQILAQVRQQQSLNQGFTQQ